MNLELRTVFAPGKLQDERIAMRAKVDLDVGDFLLSQTGYLEDSPNTEIFHSFWFPYHEVAAGELIVIYTKKGMRRKKELASGEFSHFFYWGLSTPIWNIPDRAAVLLHAPNWTSKTMADLYGT